MNILETHNLTFAYGKQPVLNDISLAVPKGSIYGYLGKNGAGKSTTIKLLLGLHEPPGDSIYYSGREFTRNSYQVLADIGNLVESPCYYANLTAYENLKYLDMLLHCGEKRIDEVLSLTGLADARNKKVKKYSMGMKQRLGIAMAIFHNPNFLILDEPLNGLDPEGVHDMRNLILNLHDEGKTIFLSSHILGEIEKICTHIGIIDEGRLIYQGLMDELLINVERKIIVRIDDKDKALHVCLQNGFGADVMESSDQISVSILNDDQYNNLLHLFIEEGVKIFSVKSSEVSLESVFLNLTDKNK